MKKNPLLVVVSVMLGVLFCSMTANAAITIRLDAGSDNADINIADVMMDVLTTRGYDIDFTGRVPSDALICLRTSQELTQSAADSGNLDFLSVGDIFSDGKELSTTVPVLAMSQTQAGSESVYRYSHLLADAVLDAYESATGKAPMDVMDDLELGGDIPSILVKVDAMRNEQSFFSETSEAGQAWIAYIIANGIDSYFIANPSAAVPRISTAGSSAAGPRINTANPVSAPTKVKNTPAADENDQPQSDKEQGNQSNGQLSPTSDTSSEADTARANEEARTLISNAVGTAYKNLPSDGSWAVYVNDLSNNVSAYAPPAAAESRMQAASLIKLFIMGAVYEQYDALTASYGEDTLFGYLHPMITVSDNDAANSLVGILGGGDSSAGMGAVNAYCQAHGYDNTSMGRLLLQSNEFGDNYTSVVDVGRFLSDIYHTVYSSADAAGGSLWTSYQQSANIPHASEMLSLLSQQERRHKIPAGMPSGVQVANKTGELGDVENDAAIIYNTENGRDLVIVFMSENLTQAGSAQEAIASSARTIYDFYH